MFVLKLVRVWGHSASILREFKKVGSNFQIKDRTVFFEPRSAWRTLLDSGFFGGNSEQTTLCADHIFGSETLFEKLRCFLIDVRTFFEQNPQ
ncbi:MAG: hypothetical protein COV10_04100 [Candidatus Vogelbacteria bacterium CG10_big_fil_rev_8_21_14_0_10_51_16]|uniref:Uncharacterized protein n=1 Tax=Candidatus Vogelbacteria bacterium CG10_big_fil_rev_8_21_14_0_10_51_16 TaxID=1975045 RepID=A0A2H0RF51_9BACT|nr:MAG: hypothetical protein COV10_04100 [Candidatus Vogelbacteria bacterium CG10_big_fil_rev_8_21_14_0_10_51_16]